LEIKGFDAFAEANIDDDDLEDLTDFTDALGFVDFDDDDVSPFNTLFPLLSFW
jgi:hypothetical protein